MLLMENEMTVVVASVEAVVIVEVAVEAWEETEEVLGVVMVLEGDLEEDLTILAVAMTEEVLLVLAAKAHLGTDLLEDRTAASSRFVLWQLFFV